MVNTAADVCGVRIVGDEIWFDGFHVATIHERQQLPQTVVNAFKEYVVLGDTKLESES